MDGKGPSEQRLGCVADLYVDKVSWFCPGSNERTVEGDDADVGADAASLDDGCPDIDNRVSFEHNAFQRK